MWNIYAIPTNGDPGYRVAGPMPRKEAQAECARLERENGMSVTYVTRYAG